jgi:catechol 2,3-dioxygenase-like lactoylglutathione lyase family enzyme
MLAPRSREGTMSLHHVAVATRDLAATHVFYTEATTEAFTDADREAAQRMLTQERPPLKDAPAPTFHEAKKSVVAT